MIECGVSESLVMSGGRSGCTAWLTGAVMARYPTKPACGWRSGPGARTPVESWRRDLTCR
jgi:hypothetical protein